MAVPLPDAFGWFNMAAGLAMLALAVGILALAHGSRLYQLLALFLALRGAMNVVEAYDSFAAPGKLAVGLLARYHVYLDVAVSGAAIAFALAFRKRYGPTPPWPKREGAWLLAILAGSLLVLLAYARDRSLYFGDGTNPGPLFLIQPGRVLLYSVIALLAALDARRALDRARSEAAELVALGFALTPLYLAPPPNVLAELLAPAGRWTIVASLAIVATAILLSIAAVVIVYRAARAGERPGSARRSIGLAGAAMASGAFVIVADIAWPAVSEASFRVLDGIFTLGLPLLVAYAILRHRLFDLDVRLRWTLSRGTLAAVFVAVFFVASEGASVAFEGWTGSPVVGIFAAGLLVFALSPLQRFAERVARAAVPGATPVQQWSAAERAEFYREQARLAWADGVLTLDERRMLDASRARLGLTTEQAAALEAEVTSPA